MKALNVTITKNAKQPLLTDISKPKENANDTPNLPLRVLKDPFILLIPITNSKVISIFYRFKELQYTNIGLPLLQITKWHNKKAKMN